MKEAADKAVKEKSGIMIGVQMNLTKLYARFFQMLYLLILQLTLQCPSAVGTPLMAKSNRIEAAARAHRAGSKSDFLIAGNCHPIVEWAEESEFNPEELAKTKIAFVWNLPADTDENYLKKLFDPLGKCIGP